MLYFLHGYTATAEIYVTVLAAPDSIDRAIAAGGREMIVVIPDAYTTYGGSMCANSPTVGDWETFIAQELPAFIDQRYRTIRICSDEITRRARASAAVTSGARFRCGRRWPSWLRCD